MVFFRFLLFFLSFSLLLTFSYSCDTVGSNGCLFNWDEGVGLNWTNWEYFPKYSLGEGVSERWIIQNEWNQFFLNGDGPSSRNKYESGANLYGMDDFAYIDINQRSPSTSTGGSFKIEGFPEGDGTLSWWLWYDGKPLSERGITDDNTDRMSFYLKAENLSLIAINDWENFPSSGGLTHIGTYLCWEGGCPYEGPNQHYYHWLNINSGAWIHVELDRHPQHRRGSYVDVVNLPFVEFGKNYFEHMNQFYIDVFEDSSYSLNIDSIYFYSTLDSVEPNQNEDSISSPWVGYWEENNYWEIGFMDNSHQTSSGFVQGESTFEIRWSINPITNANYEQATPINALYYSGEEFTGENNSALVRRGHPAYKPVWTRFELPNIIELNNENFEKVV